MHAVSNTPLPHSVTDLFRLVHVSACKLAWGRPYAQPTHIFSYCLTLLLPRRAPQLV